MTSKIQKAKEEQGYSEKPMTCSNRGWYESNKIEEIGYGGKPYFTEKNKRCTLGEFAVKNMATCKLHALKKEI